MKILITGGFGYLGSKLSKLLADKGHKIRIFSNNPPKNLQKNKYEILIGDILDKKKINEACKGIDYVLHLAGLDQQTCENKPKLALLVNGTGTKNVLEAAQKEHIKKFIYMSTSQVYGKLNNRVTEETTPVPINDYGKTKLLGENYCKQFNNDMKCIVIRLSNAYGVPLTDSGLNLVVNDLCKQSVENQKIILKTKGKQKRDFIAIPDLFQAIGILLDLETKDLKENIFNVGGNNSLSIYELAKLIAQTYLEIYGKEVKIEFDENLNEVPITDFVYDISRIRKLGFNPKAEMKEEIKETLEVFEKLKND